MEGKALPKLLVSRDEAEEKIRKRIEKGQTLRDRQMNSEDELKNAIVECKGWSRYNTDLLSKLLDNMSTDDYSNFSDWNVTHSGSGLFSPDPGIKYAFSERLKNYRKNVDSCINSLEGILDRLELFDELPDPTLHTVGNSGTHVFIGHGRSQDWRELKDFISDKLKLPWDEFNRVPVAGFTNIARLAEMLDQACMAFLVMTAEDGHTDSTLHARENVIHEAGLFQGRLGFERAIILLEEGCEEFSNIHGLGQIRFPKGNIKAAFEEIREVLEREGIIV